MAIFSHESKISQEADTKIIMESLRPGEARRVHFPSGLRHHVAHLGLYLKFAILFTREFFVCVDFFFKYCIRILFILLRCGVGEGTHFYFAPKGRASLISP